MHGGSPSGQKRSSAGGLGGAAAWGLRSTRLVGGSGMEAATAERAFERFEKGADSPGSGLGLAIARDLTAAQGGSIELSSSPGQGTTVRVSFPLAGSGAA